MTDLVNLALHPKVQITAICDRYHAIQRQTTHCPIESVSASLYNAHPELRDLETELATYTRENNNFRFFYTTFMRGIVSGYPVCCSLAFGNRFNYPRKEDECSSRWPVNNPPKHYRYTRCPICESKGRYLPLQNRKLKWDSLSPIVNLRSVMETIKEHYAGYDRIEHYIDLTLQRELENVDYVLGLLMGHGFTYELGEDETFQCSVPTKGQLAVADNKAPASSRLFVVNTKTNEERLIAIIKYLDLPQTKDI